MNAWIPWLYSAQCWVLSQRELCLAQEILCWSFFPFELSNLVLGCLLQSGEGIPASGLQPNFTQLKINMVSSCCFFVL